MFAFGTTSCSVLLFPFKFLSYYVDINFFLFYPILLSSLPCLTFLFLNYDTGRATSGSGVPLLVWEGVFFYF